MYYQVKTISEPFKAIFTTQNRKKIRSLKKAYEFAQYIQQKYAGLYIGVQIRGFNNPYDMLGTEDEIQKRVKYEETIKFI
jgi:hypothetical protein